MAITQESFIANYKKSRGLVGDTFDANLKERMDALYNAMIYDHYISWNWEFLEDAEGTELSWSSGESISIANPELIVIKNIWNSTTGLSNRPNIIPIAFEYYRLKQETEGSAASTSTTHIALNEDKLYPYPTPTTGLKLKISGMKNYNKDSGAVPTITLPDRHEQALFHYMDYLLQKKPLDDYIRAATMLGGKPLEDFWGRRYGVNAT